MGSSTLDTLFLEDHKCGAAWDVTMNVGDWLRSLGLGQYEATFRDSEIDSDVLRELTESDLEKLGVPMGHRKRLIKAIVGLSAAATAPNTATLRSDAVTAERRQLTVMFIDLVGSTALSATLDPEDLRSVIGAYQRCCAELVERNGGFIAKYMGDGVLAYFGYPQAHEHDAERAVRAGLALVEAVPKLRTVASVSLQVRVGIATGLVVVGDLIGSGEAQERGIIGETPNLAARLQALAEPNTVVIADGTRRLLGNLFELEDLGVKDFKGIAGPARAFAALRASSVESRFEALHTAGLTALVGREEEYEMLLRRWSRTKSGEGQVVLLSGEAGIGKSRLTAALLERLAAEPHTRLRYFCSPQHTDSALYSIIGQMDRAAGLAHNDKPQARLDKLDALLAQTSTSTQDAALFAEMLSLPNDGRYPVLEVTPEQRRQRTLEALMAQLAGLARQNPVLMIVEDAHWIDPTSLEVFGRTVDRIKTLPALLIVTFRPEFNAPWVGHSHVTSLTLNRLGEREAAAIIARLVGNEDLPEDVMAEIVERTDGIPLFVEEMTKAVLEAKSESVARHTIAAVPSPAQVVPASLQASLMARLDRLGPAKEVAQIGAVIGREFCHGLLAAVVCKPEAELGSALDRLSAASLLFRQGAPPHATYLFKHALIQDAAYDSLLRSRRQKIHSRVAEVLKGTGFEAEPELIAHHFSQAGMDREAAPEWLHAGQRAIVRSANVEAMAHLKHGLEALHELLDCEDKRNLELDMQISLGSATIAVRDYAATETEAAYSRARQLLAQTEHDHRHFAVLHGISQVYWNRAQFKSMGQVADEMLARSGQHSDPLPRLVSHRVMAAFLNTTGKFAEASLHGERAVDLYKPDQHHHTAHIFGHDVGVAGLWHTAIARLFMGDLQSSALFAKNAADLTRQLQNANTTSYSSLWAAFTALLRRDWTEARDTANGMMADAGKRSMAQWMFYGHHLLGCALSGLGEPTAALGEIHRGRHAATALENRAFQPMTFCFEAQAMVALGRFDEALACLSEALRLVEETDERWWHAEIYRVMGDTISASGDATDSAEASFRKAIEIATQQESKLLKLRSVSKLGPLAESRDKSK